MILQILSELGQISEADIIDVGDGEVQPGERAVGTVSLNAKRLFVAMKRRVGALTKEVEELNRATSVPADLIMKTRTRLEAEAERLKLLREIFWREIREELDLPDNGVVIRKGWKVVSLPSEPPDPISEAFSALLGVMPNCGDPDCPVHGHLNRQSASSQHLGEA